MGPGETQELVRNLIDQLYDGETAAPHILIGPVVRDPANPQEWYFAVAGANKDGLRGGRVTDPNEEDACRTRVAVLLVLALALSHATIHDFDDELDMAEEAVKRWPSDKSRQIRDSIRHERRQRMH